MAIQATSGISAPNTLASIPSVSNQTTPTTKSGGAAPAGKPGGGGGAPKAKSGSSSRSSSDTKIYDKMDTDKDGTISAQEKAACLMLHPEEATDNSESINYNGLGSPPEDQGGLSTIINLYA